MTDEEQVDAIAARIGRQDYSVHSINGRGHLVISLCLQGWTGRRGLVLLWRLLRLLWRGMDGSLLNTWVLQEDGDGKEI